MKNEIILFENEKVKLEVNVQDETVWLTQAQMVQLFNSSKSNISEHVKRIFEEGELEENSTVRKFRTVQKEGNREISRDIDYYNLDVIISIGYRVKSKVGTQFRIWANKILKKYLLEGYAINQKRLEYLQKTVKLIDIATRIDEEAGKEQGQQILKVIKDYTVALDLLDNYDYKEVKKPKGTIILDKKLKYEECLEIIKKMKFNEKSNLFALERENRIRIYY